MMKPIKFIHSENKLLEFDMATCGSPVMQLGALFHTMTASGDFPTDAEGLERAVEVADSALYAFALHVESIGHLIVHSNQNDVDEGAMTDIGNMLAMFGRNILDIANLKMQLEDALKKEETKPTRKGSAK